MTHDVFISYADEDRVIAEAVCQSLETSGITCWYAARDMSYGEDFEETIVNAIFVSRLVILILSSHCNASPHVKREIQIACKEEKRIPVLPFRVEDVAPSGALQYYISSVHWFDAVTPPLGPHLQLLVERVRPRLLGTPGRPISQEAVLGERVESFETAAEPVARQRAETTNNTRAGPTGQYRISQSLPPASIGPPVKVPNYLAAAIVSVFCCWPLAIPAIVFAAQVGGKAAAGDIQGAMASSKKAKTLSFIAIGLGLVFYFLYFLAAVLGGLKR